MKVRVINPGKVYHDPEDKFFYYSIVFDGVEKFDGHEESANAAKQKMREAVFLLRKKHGARPHAP